MRCVWGEHEQQHSAIIPFFRSDYKVFGLMGFSIGSPAAWYPGTPVHVAGRTLRFKDSYADVPPQLAEMDADEFAGAYYYDPWGVLLGMFMAEPRLPSLEEAVNLAAHTMRGRLIVDVLLESALHRVRGFLLKGRWFRVHRVSTLNIPNLPEAIEPFREPRPVQKPVPQDMGEFLNRLLRPGRKTRPLTPRPGSSRPGEPQPPRGS